MEEMVTLGTKLSVSWGSRWYEATVVNYDAATGVHDLLYAKGDFEQSKLEEITYKVITEEDEAQMEKTPATKSPSSASHCHKSRTLLLDFEDLLPIWAVQERGASWWADWRKRTNRAVRDLPGMKKVALEFASQLSAHVASEWWTTQETAWKSRVEAAADALELFKLVTEMRVLAVKWFVIFNQIVPEGEEAEESFPNTVTCSLCHKRADIQRLGRFVDSGVKGKRVKGKTGKRLVVHEQCATWSPEVHVDDNEIYVNLAKAIRRGQKLKCHAKICKKTGATLGCHNAACNRTYHYLCAVESGCHLDDDKYLMACEKHPFTEGLADTTGLGQKKKGSRSENKPRPMEQQVTKQTGTDVARKGATGKRRKRENSNSPPEEAKKAISHCGVVASSRVQPVGHRPLEKFGSGETREKTISECAEDDVWVDACLVQETPADLARPKTAIAQVPPRGKSPLAGNSAEDVPEATRLRLDSPAVRVGMGGDVPRKEADVNTSVERMKSNGTPWRTPSNAQLPKPAGEGGKFTGTNTALWERIRAMTAGVTQEEEQKRRQEPEPNIVKNATKHLDTFQSWYKKYKKGEAEANRKEDKQPAPLSNLPANQARTESARADSSKRREDTTVAKGEEVVEEEEDVDVGGGEEDDDELLAMNLQIGSAYSKH